MLRSQRSVDQGEPQGFLTAWRVSLQIPTFWHIALSSAAHVILRKRNLTLCCPAR